MLCMFVCLNSLTCMIVEFATVLSPIPSLLTAVNEKNN